MNMANRYMYFHQEIISRRAGAALSVSAKQWVTHQLLKEKKIYSCLNLIGLWVQTLQEKHELQEEMYCNCLYRCRAATQSAVDVCHSREYLMIYRGPGFLAVVRFGSSPTPSHPLFPQPLVSLSQSSCLSPVDLTDGRGGRGWASESLARYKSFNTLWGATVQALWEIPVAWCRPQPSESSQPFHPPEPLSKL